MSDPEDEEMPYVCSGCHAVGGEPCLPGCIDAELEAEREDDSRRGYGDYGDYGDDDDEARDDSPFGPAPDDGGDEVSNAVALLEAALESSALLPQIEALEAELSGSDDFPGARCCVGCRELVLDDFEHDFCEPEEPTEKMARPEPEGTSFQPFAEPRVWKDELLCPGCSQWKPVELVAPRDAVLRHMISSTTFDCACGLTTTVSYSWRRGAVVGLRFEKKRDQVLN